MPDIGLGRRYYTEELMFQRKHHIAFVVIAIIAVATMVLYSLSGDEEFAPGQNGERMPAAAGE